MITIVITASKSHDCTGTTRISEMEKVSSLRLAAALPVSVAILVAKRTSLVGQYVQHLNGLSELQIFHLAASLTCIQ
jgi:hypothetical protein